MSLTVVAKGNQPVAPKHLRTGTAEWYAQIVKDYELESHHLRILLLACEAWDTYCTAREAVDTHGMTFINSKVGDVKMRPEVSIMRDSKDRFSSGASRAQP